MSIISYSSEAAAQVSDRHVGPEARGIFAFIMSALHASRQRQAHRLVTDHAVRRRRQLRLELRLAAARAILAMPLARRLP